MIDPDILNQVQQEGFRYGLMVSIALGSVVYVGALIYDHYHMKSINKRWVESRKSLENSVKPTLKDQ